MRTPNNAEALYFRGRVLIKKNALDDAIRDFSSALGLNAKHSDAYYLRGWARYNKGQFEDALTDFRLALEHRHPSPQVPWADIGNALTRLGRHEEAVAAFSQSLKIDPRQPAVLLERGEVHAKLGNREAAVRDYRAARALAPEDPVVLKKLDALGAAVD